jgi:hypothetical protein
MKLLQKIKRLLAVASVLLFLPADSLAASSYAFDIENDVDYPLAWSFEPKTVAQAFPSAWSGSTLRFWNANQTWTTITWISFLGAWSNPTYTINTGVGFIWSNTSGQTRTVTASGNIITNSSFSFSFTGTTNWYLIADPYFRSQFTSEVASLFLECVEDGNSGWWNHYTAYSFGSGVSLANGDEVFTWLSPNALYGGVRTSSCSQFFSPFWDQSDNRGVCDWAWPDGTSPWIIAGRAFWYKPSSSTSSWTIYPTVFDCADLN